MSLLLIAFLSMTSISLANYEASTWKTMYSNNLNFKATYTDWAVKMTWNRFSVPANTTFAYYKIVRSKNNENPVYPDDWYIKYDSNLDFTSYTDNDPSVGKNYYRVCAILDWQKRHCSNVIKITVNWDTATTEEQKTTAEVKESKSVSNSTLSDEMKVQLDSIANAFLAKVNQKYSNWSTEKTRFIKLISSQLDWLSKKNSKIKPMIDYIKSKIEIKVDPLDEIKSILNLE